MTKLTYILIAFLFLGLISCEEVELKSLILEKKEGFIFPVIIDDFEEVELRAVNVTSLEYKHYRPYYLGKLMDTTPLKEYINTTQAFPGPAPDSKDEYVRPPKGKFDDYFISWNSNIKFKRTDSSDFLIKVDTSQLINPYGRKSYPILIQNTSDDTVRVGFGRKIPATMEAKNRLGEWMAIERVRSVGCSAGNYSIILPPDEIAITSALVYSGDFKTKLRIKLGNNYSNEFNGEINET